MKIRISLPWVINQIRHVSMADIKIIGSRQSKLINKLSSIADIRQEFERLILMIKMVRDYVNKSYGRVPFWTVSACTFALLYVINPFDLIPDALPGVGYLDDLAVIRISYDLVKHDLHNYKHYRRSIGKYHI